MTTYNEAERKEMLAKMREASRVFYAMATRTRCHAFIEFTGLMNEYIKVCGELHREGVDFTELNVHSGRPLPLPSHSLAYLNEKLECIFGREVRFE